MKNVLKKLLFLISITLVGLGEMFSAPLSSATGSGSISGQVTDADTETGLAGAYIVCHPWGYQTQTDILGEYTLINLPPDTYTVTASLSGYHYTVVEDVTVAESGPGLNQENIDLAMSPASDDTADGYENDDAFDEANIIWVDGSISVLPPQVHNFHQSGDQDWVKFYALGTIVNPTPYTIRTNNLGVSCDTVITLYDENQEIVRGPVDDYWEGEDEELSWNCPAEGYYYVKISSGQPTLFGENTNYELSVYIPVASTPGIITGTIENSLDSSYITGANITTDTGGTALSLTGHYVMTAPAGQCTVTASKEGYRSSSISSIVVSEGGQTSVDFSLIPVGTQNSPPYNPTNPSPSDGATNRSLNLTLTWQGGDPDGDTVTYDIYFGTSDTPSLAKSNHNSTNYNPGTLEPNTTYYWTIVAWDSQGEKTEAPVWYFATGEEEEPSPCPATVALEREEYNLSLLRKFRDEVLAEDVLGEEYIDLFYHHAPEISWLLLRDAELRSRTSHLLRMLLPQIRSLLEGYEVTFTNETMQEIESLLNQFEGQVSPELRDAIRGIRGDFLNGAILELALDSKPSKQVSLRFPPEGMKLH